MKKETIQHIARSPFGEPIRELLLETDEEFVYTALEKGMDISHFWMAQYIRDEDLIPMKWTLNRMLNENGRVFQSLGQQKAFIVKARSGYTVVSPLWRNLLRRYHRRVDVGKEYAAKLVLLYKEMEVPAVEPADTRQNDL